LADGKRLELWSDGTMCTAFGFIVRGSPRPRTEDGIRAAMDAGWLVMGECEIFDFDDIEELIAAARWTATRNGTTGDVRDRFWSQRGANKVPKPVWSLASGGERWWVLPRLSVLRGLAVLDTGMAGRRRFRVMTRVAALGEDVTFAATGFEFASLREVTLHLAENV